MGASRTACWDTADCSHHVWNTPEEGQEIDFFFFNCVFYFQLLGRKHVETNADLCCDGYLLGEYMLPSLLEGPMLFWLPGGPMLPSIPMTWSGLRSRQNTHFNNQTGWLRGWSNRRTSGFTGTSGWPHAQVVNVPPVVAWSVGILRSAHA